MFLLLYCKIEMVTVYMSLNQATDFGPFLLERFHKGDLYTQENIYAQENGVLPFRFFHSFKLAFKFLWRYYFKVLKLCI